MYRQFKNFRGVIKYQRTWLVALVGTMLTTACVENAPPRSFTEFMDDTIAREGTLVRCNADRDGTAGDPECINARRAAAALAAQAEAAKQNTRDASSEARLLAARERYDAIEAAARDAKIAAANEKQRAYESQWATDPADGSSPSAQPQGNPAPVDAGVRDVQSGLEPIALPRSVLPPLTTVNLPRNVRPIEYAPPEPELQEVVVSRRPKPLD